MSTKGKRMSDEQRHKISLSMKGRKRSKEHCRNITLSLTGKKHTKIHAKNSGLGHIKNPGNNEFDRYLRKRYGITEDQHKELLNKQGGHCALCPKTLEDNGRKFAVDHDHVTGKVRGLLCKEHNTGLGYFHDSIEELELAIKYLKQ